MITLIFAASSTIMSPRVIIHNHQLSKNIKYLRPLASTRKSRSIAACVPESAIYFRTGENMAVALTESSFISSPLTSSLKPHRRTTPVLRKHFSISCRHIPDEDHDSTRKSENQLAKLALVAVAAGVLTLGSVDPATAAKTGGRVGGQAFRPSAPPRSSGPRINNSRTNVFINPPVAPPLVGGYGYGFGVPFYGGWGWSPFSFFAPGPSVAVGVGGGFDFFFLFIVLGAVSAVVRRFFGSRRDDDDDEY